VSRSVEDRSTALLDAGAFTAAMFEAYKSDCECRVCRILRRAAKKFVERYLGEE